MHFKEDSRFKETIAAFDALNGQDPHTVEVDEQSMPKELHDALAMTRWVEALYPKASGACSIAKGPPRGGGLGLGYRIAQATDHKSRCVGLIGVNASNKGIQPLDLMRQTI
mgnify:CR=1 FL=1